MRGLRRVRARATRSPGSPTSRSTRSSTAARSRPGSRPARAATSRPCATPGSSPRSSTSRSCARSTATWRSATCATRPPAAAPGRTRQPVWRDDGREVALAHNGNLTNAVELYNELREQGHRVPRHLRLGDHRRAALDRGGAADRERRRGGDAAPRGRLLDRGDDQARRRRLPRPARRPAAVARQARRPLLRRLGELRLRHHRRRAGARGQPGRGGLADRRRARDAARSCPSERPAHCVFEHIYFSRPDSRLEGRVLQEVRGRMGEILAREAPVDADLVIAVPDSGNPAANGFARESGPAQGRRPDQEPLRRSAPSSSPARSCESTACG